MSSDAAVAAVGGVNKGQGLVPKLRFPEFRDSGAWSERALAAVADLKAGKFTPSASISSTSGEGLFPCYGGNGLRGYIATYTHTGKFPLIGRQGALCGNVNFGNGSFYATEHALVASARHRVSVDWLYYLLVRYDLNRFKTGQAQPGLSVDVLDKLPCCVPIKVEEQQRIADCLSSLDAVIAAEEERLAVLRDHKKGLMQALLPTDGRTTPRLRFPEFRDAGEWDSVELGSVADVQLGKMLDQKKAGSAKRYPYLNNIAVRWHHVETANLPEMDFHPHELDRFGLKAGDVLVCEGGEPGRAAVWDGRHPAIKFQKAIHRVRFRVPYEPELFVTFLEGIVGTDGFRRILTGEGIKHLTRENFLKLRVPIIGRAEREKLNSTFASVSKAINGTATKIGALNGHKSFLMQQLFPSPARASV